MKSTSQSAKCEGWEVLCLRDDNRISRKNCVAR